MSAFAECCVCWEEIGASKNNCTTPCGHQFCFTCIAKCLGQNNSCPLCRGVLIEREEEDNSDDESEWEESEDEGADDDSDYEEDDNVDIITERFMKKGYDAMDLVTLLLGKVKKSNPKYTKNYVKKMVADFDETVDEVETQNNELEGMAAEDTRVVVSE